jgi:hypothetical protein
MSPNYTSFKSESNKDLLHPFHSGGKLFATNVPDVLHHETDVPATTKNWKAVQMRSVLPSAVEEEYSDLANYVSPIKKVGNDQAAPSVHALLRSIDPLFNVIVQVFNGQKKRCLLFQLHSGISLLILNMHHLLVTRNCTI